MSVRPVDTNPAILYNIPQNKRASFKVFMTNTTGSNVLAKLYVREGVGVVTDENLLTIVDVGGNTTVVIPSGVLNNSVIYCQVSSGNTITFKVNSLEESV